MKAVLGCSCTISKKEKKEKKANEGFAETKEKKSRSKKIFFDLKKKIQF